MFRVAIALGMTLFTLTATTLTAARTRLEPSVIDEPRPPNVSSSPPLDLKVVKNQILDSHDQPVRLRGVNTASLEWTSNGEGHILETVKTAITDWHVNHIWQRGGKVTERASRRNPPKTYEAVGMQTLLDTIRETGARNAVIAGGLNWSYDMSGFLQGKQLSDPDGNGVIYANHAYPFKGDTVEKWIGKMEKATKDVPVIVSEFGAEGKPRSGPNQNQPAEDWVKHVLAALGDHEWSWTAWDLHPAAGPRLISDWKYTPTPTFGKLVKEALLARHEGPVKGRDRMLERLVRLAEARVRVRE